MTHYSYSERRTFTGVAFNLKPGDELDILAGALIDGRSSSTFVLIADGARIDNNGVVTNTIAVLGMGGGSTLSNHGQISSTQLSYGDVIAVRAASSPAAVNYIYNDGTIAGGGYANAITATAPVRILNSGTIQSDQTAISSLAASQTEVVNYGRIVVTVPTSAYYSVPAYAVYGAIAVANYGTMYGIVSGSNLHFYSTGELFGPVSAPFVENYGTIKFLDQPFAVQGTSGADSFINDGVVTGGVYMTGGNDVVIQTHGSVVGLVDLGDGNDGYTAVDGTVSGTIAGGAGNDSIQGGSAADRIYGDAVNGTLTGDDTLFGGGGADIIYGGNGADILAGNTGDDMLYGDAGNDRMWGGQGSDVLTGGAGDDLLYGGLADDRFVFAAGFGRDTIEDFGVASGNSDTIRFQGATFADYAAVQSHMAQQGTDVVITLDAGNTVTILNMTVAALTADHFQFG